MVFFYTISRNLHAENREIRILRISVFVFFVDVILCVLSIDFVG